MATSAAAAVVAARIGIGDQVTSNLAASDAAHDFSSIFPQIFKKIYKPIGTLPIPENYFSEWKSFEQITNLSEEKFKTTFCRTEGNIQKIPINGINYVVKSILLAQKKTGEKTPKTWIPDAKKFIDYLKIGRNFDFTIDAVGCDFYNYETTSPIKSPIFFNYFKTREGINDPAGKVDIRSDRNENMLKINTIIDNDNKPVIYPSVNKGGKFNSIFDLILSPIHQSKNQISLTFKSEEDGSVNNTFIISKGKTEDNNTNAKGAFYGVLQNFFNKTSPKKRDTYYISLQRKRSGDWLQVLSTLEGRLNRNNITLVTHDAICAAYSLYLGGNVLLTINERSGDNTNYYLVYFQRNVPRIGEEIVAEIDEVTVFMRQLESFKSNFENLNKYNTQLERFNNDKIEHIIKEFQELPDLKYMNGRLPPIELQKNFIKSFKQIILDIVQFCIFIQNNQYFQSTKIIEATRKIVTADVAQKLQYYHEYSNLVDYIKYYESILSDLTRFDKYEDFFDNKYIINNKLNRDILKLVENLRVFKEDFFSIANGGSNGAGIFTFIKSCISDNRILKILYDNFQNVANKLPLENTMTKNYGEFINHLYILWNSSDAPDVEISSSVDHLISVVQEIDKEQNRVKLIFNGNSSEIREITDEIAVERVEPVDPIDYNANTFQLSDYEGARIMLARAWGFIRGAVYAVTTATIGSVAPGKRGTFSPNESEVNMNTGENAVSKRSRGGGSNKDASKIFFFFLVRELGFRIQNYVNILESQRGDFLFEKIDEDELITIVLLSKLTKKIIDLFHSPVVNDDLLTTIEHILLTNTVIPGLYMPSVYQVCNTLKSDYLEIEEISFAPSDENMSMAINFITRQIDVDKFYEKYKLIPRHRYIIWLKGELNQLNNYYFNFSKLGGNLDLRTTRKNNKMPININKLLPKLSRLPKLSKLPQLPQFVYSTVGRGTRKGGRRVLATRRVKKIDGRRYLSKTKKNRRSTKIRKTK